MPEIAQQKLAQAFALPALLEYRPTETLLSDALSILVNPYANLDDDPANFFALKITSGNRVTRNDLRNPKASLMKLQVTVRGAMEVAKHNILLTIDHQPEMLGLISGGVETVKYLIDDLSVVTIERNPTIHTSLNIARTYNYPLLCSIDYKLTGTWHGDPQGSDPGVTLSSSALALLDGLRIDPKLLRRPRMPFRSREI